MLSTEAIRQKAVLVILLGFWNFGTKHFRAMYIDPRWYKYEYLKATNHRVN